MSHRAARWPQIAIDAGPVAAGPRSGIGQATAGLLDALTDVWPTDWPAPIAWINSPRHPLPTGDRWLRSGLWRVVHTRWSGKMLLRGWQWLDRPKLERLVGAIDLVHSPSGVIPSVRAARRILTVHDLYFRHRPEHTDTYGGRYFAATYPRRLPHVDACVCISQFTRAELLRFYSVDPARLRVIHWGVDVSHFRPEPADGDGALLASLGVRRPYLVCLATQEPRKNLERLVAAYARMLELLRGREVEVPDLVLAGGQGWGVSDLDQQVRLAGLGERVRLIGYQPRERVPTLYRHAMAMVFPPLYEGFGLPVLEAMACGCPCVLSGIEALREVAGESAAWFDPLEPEAMAHVLAQVVEDGDKREMLRRQGLARVRRFSWSAAAQATIELYREVLQS